MIKLEKVNKYFNHRRKNEIHIINNTSLTLGDNGLVAILGQSGSGKTTLLNVIGGLDKVNSGKIYINGKKITHRSAYTIDKIRNLNIGYVFQDYKLIENMTVFNNVAISLRMIGLKNKKEIEKRVNYVLEAVNMYRFRNRPAGMLSGGEKQRVAIARALVKNPSILIADEPTGNLDSQNSVEVMNILKAISKEKLVILVTHEENLAHFYATRIIEVKDGTVTKDYENTTSDSLEYRLENRIYLKDFPKSNEYKNDDETIKLYSDNESKNININLVIKNGNIYIQSDNNKVEVVDENSSIELVDDHFKKIDKSIYEQYDYDINSVSDYKFKPKYSSIYGVFKSLKSGFTRISNYTVTRKILLVGFFFSAMFLLYGISNIEGEKVVKESDFIKTDPNYLYIDMSKVSVEDFGKYEKIDGVDYAIPGDSNITFRIKTDDFYQTSNMEFDFKGSMVSLDKINKSDITTGRMPENEYELVVDKKILTDMINDQSTSFAYMGIKNENELLNKTLTLDNMKDFKIVGFVDKGYGTIYANKNLFFDILHNSSNTAKFSKFVKGSDDYDLTTITQDDVSPSTQSGDNFEIEDYNLSKDDLTITKGRVPENDYEIIVNKSNEYSMKLDKEIESKINEHKLKVVGYYESKSNSQKYYTNLNTIKYDVITKNSGIMIYPKNKEQVYGTLKNEYKVNVLDTYEENKKEYINKKKQSTKNSIIFASIILAISLIEIYLMIRSSFLSRIKEIGILRAIGIKKGDVRRMFTGEILAITTVASMPGVALMTYILYELSKVKYVQRMYLINPRIVLISVVMVYAFNLIVGLLPLSRILRKKPAQIISRQDV